MKVAVVTGSSSGIGKEAARELAAKGFHVVFACRNKAKAEEAMKYAEMSVPAAKMTFLELDTGKMKSVKAFVAAYLEKFDRLDVLVHNAGCGYFLKKDRTTEDGLEAFFATNYLGPFLLTKLFLDLLKKSQGRVVCVSSIEHWEGSYDFEKVTEKTGVLSYSTSKLMQMLLAFELCRRHNIPTAAVNPGAVMSGIWWYLRGFKKMIWDWLVAPLFLLNVKQGCQTIVHAATVESLPTGPVYYTPYKQYSWCPYHSDMVNLFNGPTLGTPDPKVYREEYWSKLWDFSEEKVKPFL
mmetsp:Transcript_79488/g.245180  ORF Transcript_79488/g.245180 Transcript_79488/m.245180 type:complete len:294 (-) Transcript_79488:58-939(-)